MKQFERYKVHKLDVNKLVPVPVDISKLSDVVRNDAVKKTKYSELVKNVNAIQSSDTDNLVKKTDYNTNINEIEKKISDHDHSNNYITMQEFNKVPSKNFAPELAQSNLASKNDIAALVKKKERFW